MFVANCSLPDLRVLEQSEVVLGIRVETGALLWAKGQKGLEGVEDQPGFLPGHAGA